MECPQHQQVRRHGFRAITANPPRNGLIDSSRKFQNSGHGQLHSEQLYRTTGGRGRSATKGITTSSPALVDNLPTPAGEGGSRHKTISSMTSPSTVKVPPTVTVHPTVMVSPTRDFILANGADFKRPDAYNKHIVRFYSCPPRTGSTVSSSTMPVGPTRDNNSTNGRGGRQWPRSTSTS